MTRHLDHSAAREGGQSGRRLAGRPARVRAGWLRPATWGIDMRPVRFAVGAGVALSAARAVFLWPAPWPLTIVFDSVLANHPLPLGLGGWLPSGRAARLDVLALAMVAIALGLGVTAYGANSLLANAGQKVVYELRVRLFRHIEAQSMSFHHRQRVGDLLARLGGDVQAMQGVVVNVVPLLAENVLSVAGMATIMFVLDWHFSLLALSIVPLLFVVVRRHLSAIRSVQRVARRNEGSAGSAAQQVLAGLPVVQAFGTEALEADRYAALAIEGLRANRKSVVLQSRFAPLVTALMTVSTALVVYFGARGVMQGRITPGDLLVFTAYLQGMYTPVRQLAKVAGMVGRGQASAERVKEILDTSEAVPHARVARVLTKARGAVSFDNVSFAYPGARAVLDGVSLEVGPGSRHALIGPTGSGKSTLMSLVPRFFDPDEGEVRLDGVDLRSLELASLRRLVTLVPQEPWLLAETVWENITYGADRQGRDRAMAVARAAGVHEVIASLRDGYDTKVGERGRLLSGGQRQCVAVARAMARDARVLLLDEPTTGLDAETESVLLDALERVSEGRTTIHVTHQLRHARHADRITMLEHGRVEEEGTRADLIGARSAYWRLEQLSAFEPVIAEGAR